MMRPMVFVLAGMILFVPNQLHFPTSLGVPGLNSFNLFFLAAIIVLLVDTATGARTTGLQAPGTVANEKPPLTGPLLAFYAVLGIALLMAFARGTAHPYPDVAIYKTVVSYSLLYFLAYYGVHDQRSIRVLLGVILFVLAVASLEAIREGFAYGFGNYENDRRASGPFSHGSGNANYAGVFYSIFASFALAIAVLGTRLKKFHRAVALGCYGLACFAIFATFSRQSFLIIGVTTLLVSLRRNPVLAVLAIMGMLSYPLWAPEGVVERVEMTQEETATGDVELENSAASRYELWGGALEIIKENPLGIGLNQFKDEIEPHIPGWITARDAQNQYLLVAAEAGIQGLVVFVVLLFALFGIARRLSRIGRSHEARTLGAAMNVAVVGVVMGNIYSSTFFSGEVMGNFWMLAGLMSKYAVLAEREAIIDGVPAATLSPLDQLRGVYARWQHRNTVRRQRNESI